MKNLLKEKFPFLFYIMRSCYHTTSFYIRKRERLEKELEMKKSKKKEGEKRLLKTIFNNSSIVLNGPFKGMKFLTETSWGPLFPKITGSYEEPIHDWIEEAINKEYQKVLVVGCAEGYYAAGFSYRLADSRIIAYDIDENAQKKVKELSRLNNLNNIEVKGKCDFEELKAECEKKTLIFCDIEGFEKELLDPIKAPCLKKVDLIVESHDCFVPSITEELVKRFSNSHRIRIVIDYLPRIKNYAFPRKISKEQYNWIIDERRVPFMKFIFMESLYG